MTVMARPVMTEVTVVLGARPYVILVAWPVSSVSSRSFSAISARTIPSISTRSVTAVASRSISSWSIPSRTISIAHIGDKIVATISALSVSVSALCKGTWGGHCDD